MATTGCTSNAFTRLGMPVPVTRQGHVILTLWQGSWIAAWIVGAVVWGLIIWAIIFHRKKRGSAQPPQTHAWFIGYRGDVSFAVLVEGGGVGGEVAAPIAANFLKATG